MENTSPSKRLKASPKDFFSHLLAMVTLYISAVSLVMAVNAFLDLKLPDVTEQEYFYYVRNAKSSLRHALSFLIVMFPVYIATNLMLTRTYKRDNQKRDLRIRKWLIYLTLFVAALVIMFSLVSTLNSFLNGELTLRFGLKLLTIIFVAAAIFGYYLYDIRKYHTE